MAFSTVIRCGCFAPATARESYFPGPRISVFTPLSDSLRFFPISPDSLPEAKMKQPHLLQLRFRSSNSDDFDSKRVPYFTTALMPAIEAERHDSSFLAEGLSSTLYGFKGGDRVSQGPL